MKRFFMSLSILLLTALCLFSQPVLAEESSYYDSEAGWLIRAYTTGGNVYIEVRDIGNQLVNVSDIVGLKSNPELVGSGATTSDISLSFDASAETAYIFYTTSGGLQLQVVPDVMLPVPQIPIISVEPESISFGNVNVGSYSDQTVKVSNTGAANLILGTISGAGNAYFSRQGGTCASSGQILALGASCTIVARFAPGAAGAFNGSLSIPSNDKNVNVPISGTGVSQIGNSDLIVTSVALTNCCDNYKPFTIKITVKNQGTGAAGAFKVKGYVSPDTNINLPPSGPPTGDTLLFTWSLTGLAAGATATNEIVAQFGPYAIHNWYNLLFKVDADGQVSETNETNNMNTQPFPLTR